MLRLIEGGISIDDRGELRFVNGFTFDGVKRSYSVTNHNAGFVRAWHGHKKEAKYITVLRGAAIIGAVKVTNWDAPWAYGTPERFVLSAARPQVLFIPAGYANGCKTLTDGAIVVYYSTCTMEESEGDDFRFPADTWDIWQVEQR